MTHKIGLFTLSLVAIALFLVGCVEKPVFREEVCPPQIKQPAVTVKLLETKNDLSIGSNGSFVIKCFPFQGEPSTYFASADMLVKPSDGGIRLTQKTQGELEANLNKILFIPDKESSYLYLNGRPYRGALKLSRTDDPGLILALNVVFVEDYLKGVVPAEMGKLGRQEEEALKVQAVAARTYALFCLGQHTNKGYDLEATVTDQIYKGIRGEDALANRAVEITGGEVLTHKGKLICAYYHANSGGKTEFIEKVWDKPKRAYLIPVDDSEFCSWSESYMWIESWTKETLEENLRRFFTASVNLPDGEFKNLLNLQVEKRSPSGRVEALDVLTERGSYRIRGDKIRWALRKGSNRNSILPSTRFDLEIERDIDGSIQRVVARGRGNGHGVGMCQTGAIGMARKGRSYRDILTYYYSGVELAPSYGKRNRGLKGLAFLSSSAN